MIKKILFLFTISFLLFLFSCGFEEETNFVPPYYKDSDSPYIVSISPEDEGKIDLNTTQIIITYSEQVLGADNINNYSLSGNGIGSLSITSIESNGNNAYSINLSGTPGDNQITLTINNITDLAGHPLSGDKSFNFIGWWNSNWNHRRKLTFNNSSQLEDLINFPVMVKLNSSRINYSYTKDNGEDIRFIDPDNTVLSYEIEKWDKNGDSVIWVKVPQIDGNSDRDYIWLYYNNSDASDAQNAPDVWSDSYNGVWHLNQISGSIFDSTPTQNNGIAKNGANFTQLGYIDGAYDFTGDGDIIEAYSHLYSFVDKITMEGWFKYLGPGNGYPRIFELSKNGNANSHCLAVDSDGSLRAWVEDSTNGRVVTADDPTTYNDGNWHYMVYSFSNPNGRLFVDGVETVSVTGNYSNIDDGSYLVIGAISDASGDYTNYQHEFDGYIDEIRISNDSKSADWIKAQYLSMTDTFITYGEEE